VEQNREIGHGGVILPHRWSQLFSCCTTIHRLYMAQVGGLVMLQAEVALADRKTSFLQDPESDS
jgi:hypothetical protein